MARTFKTTFHLIVRRPVMDYRSPANYGISFEEADRLPRSSFIFLPFLGNCLVFCHVCTLLSVAVVVVDCMFPIEGTPKLYSIVPWDARGEREKRARSPLPQSVRAGSGLEEERREDGEQDGDAEGEQVRRGPVVRAVGLYVCGKNAVEEGHREEHAGAAGERHR